MSREKLLPLFFACISLTLLIWPRSSNALNLQEELTQYLIESSQIALNSESPEQEIINSTKVDSANLLLLNYISQAKELWKTDKARAESLLKLGFRSIDFEAVNDTIIAEAYHFLGKILVDKNDLRAGIDTLFKCIEIKKKAFGENSPTLSKTYNYIGIGYYGLREYDSASTYYSYSINQKRLNGLVDEDLFDAYLNLGVLNGAYGKYSKAYRFFDSVNYLIDSIEPPIDSLRIAFFYYNYGALAMTNGKLKEANEFYYKSEAIILKIFGPDDPGLAGIYTNKGVNSLFDLNFNQALYFFKNALEINLLNQRFKTRVPKSYANLSLAAIELKDYSGAVKYCQEGLKYNSSGDIKLVLYLNLALSLSKLGKLNEADSNYVQALIVAKNENVGPTRSISLNKTYADFLLKNNEFNKSKRYYKNALNQAVKYYGKNSLAKTEVKHLLLSKLGDYYSKHQYNFDSAKYYYNKSIDIWNNILSLEQDSVIFGFLNESGFVDAYAGKAELLYNLYKNNQDTSLLAESSRLLNILLNRADLITKNLDKQNSYLLLEIVKPIYELAIEVSYEKYIRTNDQVDLVQAFEYAERSKSSVLLSSIQNNNALKTAEVPLIIVNQDEQIQSEINGLRKLLADEENKPDKSNQRISFFNSRLLELMIRHDSLINEIEKQHPKYYALKYDRSVTNVKTVQEKLLDDEVILEYVLTDSALFIFSIGKENQELTKVNIDSSFYNSLYYLIEIKNVDLNHSHSVDFSKYISSSYNLWHTLISPIYKNLDSKRLIIIPDGLLGYLSFDLLIKPSDELPNNLVYRNLPFLIKEFPISYAYSSSLKYNTYFKREKNANRNLIGFAPIYTSASIVNNILKPLPGAKAEVLDAKAIFGGEAYLNDKATKANFLRNATKFKIIHLAMHTLINDSLPMFSELVFSNTGLDSNDQKLLTYEIYGLNLDADMITLSACNTGTGKLQHGEGIMSLSRGFVYAGVPSIVMTLWDVQDNSSSEIMKSYYTYLHQGQPKDIALQKAKIDFLEGANMLKAHPYYWSAYIITGDASPIVAEQQHNWIELFTGLGIFILAITLVFIKAKSAKTI